MEFSRKQVSTILDALRASPRGLNVSEASRVTGLNRSTVAKYLEMLYVSGHADMRTFGTSKLYYISQRMPISAFLNFSSDLIIVLDKNSRVLNANDSFFEFTGTRREDVVHKYFDNFAFPLKFNPSIMPFIVSAIDGREAAIESYYPKKDSGHYFNIKLIPLLFDNGDKGVTIIFEDITEKKLAEKALLNANFELENKVRERTKELQKANEALRKSEAYLLEAEQIAHLGYWSYDIMTKESRASDEALRLFGQPPDAVWNRELFMSMVRPEDIRKIEKADQEAMSRDAPVDYEYRIILADGSERIIRSVRGTRRNEAGEIIEMFGTIQDITGQKRMEIALKESEERLHLAIDGADMGMWDTDRLTGESIWSDRTFRMLGYKPAPGGKATMDMWMNLVHPDDVPGILDVIKKSVRDRSTYIHEHRIIRADNGRVAWLQIFNRFVFDEAGRAVRSLGVILDITERKRIEEALEAERLQLLSIFDSIGQPIYVADPRTYEILFANKAMQDRFGRSLVGSTCYREIQHRDAPCEFCSNPVILKNKGEPYYWEFHNPIVNKDFMITDRIIKWPDGRDVRFEMAVDITERKRMEEALRESEERYRIIAEKSYDVVFSVRADGTISYVSPQIAYYGYDPEQLSDQNFFELIASKYRDFLAGRFRDTMLNGESPPTEFKLLGKDGKEYWAEITGKTAYDDEQKPMFVVGTVRNTDERKRAEEALRNSELRFKTLFEGSSTAIFIIDLSTRVITDCNEYAARLVGRTKEELIGMHHSKLHPPESAEPCRRNDRIHAKDGRAMNYETELVHKDGRRIPILISSTIMQVDGKKFMIGSYLDITGRKRVEGELRKSEERYRSLFENKHDLVWETDENNLCTYMSPRAKDIVGYEQDEIIGKTPFDYMPPDEVMRVMGQIKPLLDENKPFEILDYYMIKKDGSRAYFNTYAMPIFDDKGRLKGYRGVCRHIGDGTNGRQK